MFDSITPARLGMLLFFNEGEVTERGYTASDPVAETSHAYEGVGYQKIVFPLSEDESVDAITISEARARVEQVAQARILDWCRSMNRHLRSDKYPTLELGSHPGMRHGGDDDKKNGRACLVMDLARTKHATDPKYRRFGDREPIFYAQGPTWVDCYRQLELRPLTTLEATEVRIADREAAIEREKEADQKSRGSRRRWRR